MKHFFSLALLLFTSLSFAQTVNIPDAFFLEALINEGVDTNGDGMIQVSEAEITDTLELRYSGINDLTGIEIFTNLIYLDCSYNGICGPVDFSSNQELLYLDCNRNECFIPVITNNQKLQYLDCSSNIMADLDVSQNSSLTHLICGSQFLQELDLSNKPDLVYLDCYDNYISNLDLSSNTNLTYLNCGNISITTLDLSNLTKLVELHTDRNYIEILDLSTNSKLEYVSAKSSNLIELILPVNNSSLDELDCYQNELTHVDFSSQTQLRILNCFNNAFTSVDLSNCPLLEDVSLGKNWNLHTIIFNEIHPVLTELNLFGADIETLDLSFCPELITLNCSGINPLVSLDLSVCPKVEWVEARACNMENLDLTNCTNLERLDVEDNKLGSIDLTDCISLETFICNSNLLTTIDFFGNPNLVSVTCGDNLYTKLSFPNSPELRFLNLDWHDPDITCLDLSHNSNFQSIRLKRTDIEFLSYSSTKFDNILSFDITSQSSIQYVCGPQSRWFAFDIFSNIIYSEHCYACEEGSSVSGVVKFSEDNCSNASSIITPNVPMELVYELDTIIYQTNQKDTFKFYFPFNEQIKLSPIIEYSDLLDVSPPSYDLFLDNAVSGIDFCVSPSQDLAKNDLALTVYTQQQPRPGIEHTYYVQYENIGNSLASGSIKFSFDEDFMTFNGSAENWNLAGEDLILEFDNLSPLKLRTSEIHFSLNSPMDNPPLNAGNILSIRADLLTDEFDCNTNNNISILEETVVNSYDPNDKICLQGAYLLPNDTTTLDLTYRIRFENTGTAEAFNVTVVDTLDPAQFNLSTFRLIEASHDVQAEIVDNVVSFKFFGIYLPHEEDENDGFVIFKITPWTDLEVGSEISNEADIYFDFNFPIRTNRYKSYIVEDVDLDGYHNLIDCDDNDPLVFSSDMEEIPYNGIDDDCNPLTLDDDLDQDGFLNVEDCDDLTFAINPDAVEIPGNGIDENCDGIDGMDNDGDGYHNQEDCDDNNPDINPDVVEIPYNGLDDDCNPQTLDDDLDQDGVEGEYDCDDNNATVYPFAPELCDGIDNNCNQSIDEGLELFAYYVDQDQDGFGDPDSFFEDCEELSEFVNIGEDCDDTNPDINPNAEDVPSNGIDENCDGMDEISSTKELNSFELSISPNPTFDKIVLRSAEIFDAVELFDLSGKTLMSKSNLTTTKLEIDLLFAPKGVFLLKTTNAVGKTNIKRIIKL